jgi:hypothetical protein
LSESLINNLDFKETKSAEHPEKDEDLEIQGKERQNMNT